MCRVYLWVDGFLISIVLKGKEYIVWIFELVFFLNRVVRFSIKKKTREGEMDIDG